MKRMGKLSTNTSLRVLVAVGLLGTAISCGDLLKKADEEKTSETQPKPTPKPTPTPEVKETPIAQYTVTSVASGLTAKVAADKTADGTAAVLTLTDVVAESQLIAVTGTCPIGSFTAPGEYTTGAIKADCEVVLKAGATASFEFTDDKLPKDGTASFVVVPFGDFNLKNTVSGTCVAGQWATDVSVYSTTISAACTATFEGVDPKAAANLVTVKPSTSAHTFTYTVTPNLTAERRVVAFSGAGKAAATASFTPSYPFTLASSTCPDGGSNFDATKKLYIIPARSAAGCELVFNITNPCGPSGIADPTTIKYTSASAADAARIDRLMTLSTTTSINKTSGAETSTGTGTANCANSSCHGKATAATESKGSGANTVKTWLIYDYSSKWRIYYNGASATTSFSVASLTANEGLQWNRTDLDFYNQVPPFDGTANTTAKDNWENKLLFPRKQGTSVTAPTATYVTNGGTVPTAPSSQPVIGVAGTVDPSFIAYDPLNSRFYRKLTTGHYHADGVSASLQMPKGATALSTEKQEMMCHWIWNGAQFN